MILPNPGLVARATHVASNLKADLQSVIHHEDNNVDVVSLRTYSQTIAVCGFSQDVLTDHRWSFLALKQLVTSHNTESGNELKATTTVYDQTPSTNNTHRGSG